MANRWTNTLKDRDCTPEHAFLNRRQWMAGAAAGVGLAGLGIPAAASETQTPLMMLCHSLATLLNASGLKATALEITQAGDHLTVTNPNAFHMYSHLLAPITRLSRPLLEQQTALLMLFVSSRLLAGDIDTDGGDQSLWVSLRLPARAD